MASWNLTTVLLLNIRVDTRDDRDDYGKRSGGSNYRKNFGARSNTGGGGRDNRSAGGRDNSGGGNRGGNSGGSGSKATTEITITVILKRDINNTN